MGHWAEGRSPAHRGRRTGLLPSLLSPSRRLSLASGLWSLGSYLLTPWGCGVPVRVVRSRAMRRAVGTRGGLEDGGPTVGTVGWDEASRCDGWRLRRGYRLSVMGY